MNNAEKKQLGCWIREIAKGKIEAVDKIYKLNGKVMAAIARMYVSHYADVEDIVHDSMLTIVRNADKFKRNTNAYAWINTIVKNTAKNRVKRNEHFQIEQLDNQYLSYESDEDDFVVREIFTHLTEYEQDLIIYKFWYGLTYDELAKFYHKSKSGIKYDLDCIYKKIKNFYQE